MASALGLMLVLAVALLATTMPAPAGAAVPSFYQSAPAGWRQKPVGALLKVQPVPRTWPCLHGLKAYRIMYVSRGASDGFAHGGKVFETGMVYLPLSGNVPAGGWPVVAWGHGTSGVGDTAAPSRYRWLYPEPLKWVWDEYGVLVGQVGRLGAIVACPDYEGMGTPGMPTYLNTGSEGRSMIDAVRAARHLAARLHVPACKKWAALGHSQGGGAAIGAAQQAAKYGRGLSMRGTVAFAPAGAKMTSDFANGFLDPMWYPYIGYMAWGVKAIDTQHQFELADMCGTWIMPYVGKAPGLYFDYWFRLILSKHWTGGTFPTSGQPEAPTMDAAFAPGWQDNPVVKRFFADWRVGQRHATGPILVVQGTNDVLYSTLDQLKSQLTAVGDRYNVVILQNRDHDQAVPYGWPAAKAFLKSHLLQP